MVLFILFYILVIPLCILLHEIGHAMGVVLTSKLHAHVYLGNRDDGNNENFRIGRIHFHLIWSFVGFVNWEGELNKRQRVFAMAGGPIMSLFLTLMLGVLAMVVTHNDFQSFFWSICIFNGINFLVTVIPMTYPSWMGAYNGHPSDGLQLLRLLRVK
ncbi:hypothetical protein [Ornithinibacillus halophilus]|uniref:Peptidase family M50 n=1 Tax=Ornithinibacillus halophilus TaxID=930117 RepID=A0A1M5P017_9BACI|nr:hypothetical protein [Ornithinibacillus halophilus]SHG95112.1 hypothetical protein SAMN05216225_10963 [Ornithinibacillus halophilus]